MSKYHVKMDGSDTTMTRITTAKENTIRKQTKSVSVKLSKNVLDRMRKYSGIKQGTDNQILHAYITKTLQDAEV